MLAASTLALAAQDKPAAPEKLKPVVVKGTAIGGEVTAVSPTLQLSGQGASTCPAPVATSATCSPISPAWPRATSVLTRVARSSAASMATA